MSESFWRKRFPTLLGLGIISISVISTTYLANKSQIFSLVAIEEIVIKDLRVSNQKEESLSISFRTDNAVPMQMEFHTDIESSELLFDDRDAIGETVGAYKIHHFTKDNLKPGQEYGFTLISGSKKIENSIDKFVAKTQLSIQSLDSNNQGENMIEPIKGVVVKSNLEPLRDAIVFVKIEGGALLSAPVNTQGDFLISLENIATSDLTGRYILRGDEMIVIEAMEGDGTRAFQSIPFGQHSDIGTVIIGDEEIPIASGFNTDISLPDEGNSEPSIVSPGNGDFLLDSKPLIRGSGKPFQRVEITIESELQEGETSVNANGQWSYQPDLSLPAGKHTLTVRFFDEVDGVKELKQEFEVFASGNQIDESSTPSPTIALLPSPSIDPTVAPIPVTGTAFPVVSIVSMAAVFGIIGFFMLAKWG